MITALIFTISIISEVLYMSLTYKIKLLTIKVWMS